MNKRIWELDALRGIGVLVMIAIHLTYDLVVLFDVVDLKDPTLFNFSTDWGGVIFLVISGLCATIGSHPVRRGIRVFGCGMLCTIVTWGMYAFGFTGPGIIIYFGVLHCLGTCMLLWPLLRRCPTWLLGVLGLLLSAVGLYLKAYARVTFPWLIPLGVPSYNFASSDYFPLLPNLGYFLLGSVIGRTLYKNKQSLLPRVNADFFPLAFLRFCGKHSLIIYLVHQPVLAALVALWTMIM